MKTLVQVFILSVFVLGSGSVVFAEDETADYEAEILADYEGSLISLDVQDADLRKVLRAFSGILQKNIVLHPAVAGRVNALRFQDVAADEAFDAVLRTYGLYAAQDRSVLVIYPLETYLKDAKARIELNEIW